MSKIPNVITNTELLGQKKLSNIFFLQEYTWYAWGLNKNGPHRLIRHQELSALEKDEEM